MPSFSRTPPPSVTPGAHSRPERLRDTISVPYFLLFLVSPLLVLVLRGSNAPFLLVAAPPISMLVLFAAAKAILRRRALRQLEAAAFRTCLHCRYDLSCCADAGTCPECGHAFDTSKLEESWRWTYGD